MGLFENPFFRLIAPFFLSFLVYFLVLLVFDTIDQIEINFFRAELILCLIISYLVFEINRILIIILEKRSRVDESLSKRIFIQITTSTLLIIAVVSSAVAFYMINLVGFKSFNTELIAFNSLYILFVWCLHAVYFSLIYLKKVTDIQIINENNRRKTVEIKMDASLKELKPKLLNKSLETLIVLAYSDPDMADEYLGKVSDFYRGKLSRKNELVSLKEEIENAVNFVEIYKPWVNISLHSNDAFSGESSEMLIMQGTISSIAEYITETAIFLPNRQNIITLEVNNDFLVLKCEARQKLKTSESFDNELNNLFDSYWLICHKHIEMTKNGQYLAKIPLIN
ncbi:MAG: histidine kinase [Chloroflexia bacterium]|nr:histidine kinase [Chloroflexia bacterium]